MPVIGLIGGIVILGVVATWAVVKLAYLAATTEETGYLHYVSTVMTVFGVGTSAILLVELWDGLAAWATSTWHWFGGLVV